MIVLKVVIDEILKGDEGLLAVSSESPFYPDGKGGQLGDRGEIGSRRVLRVFERKGRIFHLIDGEIQPGEYEARIDEKRRKEIARQHTAQHILSAAFVKIADIETVSFHMGEEYSTIDLDVSIPLESVIEEVENLTNEIVVQNKPVRIHIVDRKKAGEFPLRKPIPDGISEVRIVEVEGFDWSACGGFHVSSTGEIGLVKILKWEKVKGDLTRVYFVAGKRSLKSFQKYVRVCKELSKILTASIDEMPSRVLNILENLRKCRKDKEKIVGECLEFEMRRLMDHALKVKGIAVLYYDGPEDMKEALLREASNMENVFMIARVEDGYEFSSGSADVGETIGTLKSRVGGKGGGGKRRGKLSVDMSKDEILENVIRIIKRTLNGRDKT